MSIIPIDCFKKCIQEFIKKRKPIPDRFIVIENSTDFEEIKNYLCTSAGKNKILRIIQEK